MLQENNGVVALQKILKFYRIGVVCLAIIIPLLLSLIIPGSGIIKWLSILALTGVAILFGMRLLLHVLVITLGGNITELNVAASNELRTIMKAKEEPQEDVEMLYLTVVSTSDNPIAKYMDTDIFEEITVKDEDSGRMFRGTYHNTVRLQDGEDPEIEPGFMILEPGIVYELTLLEDQVDDFTK